MLSRIWKHRNSLTGHRHYAGEDWISSTLLKITTRNTSPNNPYQPYCVAVVAPKVIKFRKHFLDMLKKEQLA